MQKVESARENIFKHKYFFMNYTHQLFLLPTTEKDLWCFKDVCEDFWDSFRVMSCRLSNLSKSFDYLSNLTKFLTSCFLLPPTWCPSGRYWILGMKHVNPRAYKFVSMYYMRACFTVCFSTCLHILHLSQEGLFYGLHCCVHDRNLSLLFSPPPACKSRNIVL